MTETSPALALPTASPELAERLLAGLASVDALLHSVVDHEDPFIAQASMHLSDAGGKRFRPMLTLLAAELGDGINPEVVKAATGVELTHLASLYHDDVMDEADVRRGVVSANARYGNSEAILVGDLLFGKASELVADLGPEAVRIQALTFVRLCSGQIRDARPVPEGVDPIDYYLGVLADKTGVLIATAARYGAMFSGCAPETVDIMGQYGERLGIAFQLADDLLDISSELGESGKEPGMDLREGVATLPVLLVRQSADPADDRLKWLLDSDLRDDALHAEALGLLRVHRAMGEARERTNAVALEARELLAPLAGGQPEGSAAHDAASALRALVVSVVNRAG
ncbi:MAG TPA: polyprenyl synthetase family protein [Dermatophilaceae bacterium]|nr:polyprenyl synthetase family protein [Dermatophilaceae bacterium]